MRNLKERLDDIKSILSDSLKDCNRSLDIISNILENETFDHALYGEAKRIEEKINLFEFRADEEVVKTIARFQPVALNLRFLIGVIKFSSCLERINDLSLNILKVMKHAENIEQYKKYHIDQMLNKVKQMYELFLKAYYQENLSYAYLVLSFDEEVNSFKNDLINKVKQTIVPNLQETKLETSFDFLEALFISQHLERIGDYIKNLSENVIYIYHGVDIRHGFAEEVIELNKKV